MNYNRKGRMKTKIISFASIGFCIIAVISLCYKSGNSLLHNGGLFSGLAGGIIMPVGAKSYIENSLYGSDSEKEETNESTIANTTEENTETANDTTSSESTDTQSATTPSTTENGETTYPIIERHISQNGDFYDNFYVKNTTGVSIDIGEELSKRPDAEIKLNSDVQVLIMHTHTSESYIDYDLGYYTESFYPRSSDQSRNIVAVGDAIKRQLESNGIATIHDTTVHDNPSYNGAYTRAAQTIENNLSTYPSLEVVLDIHRDALGNDEVGRSKPTFTYNGRKAAQIMIISGCGEGGTWYFPDWEYNLRLALRIQQKAETMYPGMTRPLDFSISEYNMSITRNSLLIEVGTDVNTFDEAVYSGELLGNVVSEVLKELAVN